MKALEQLQRRAPSGVLSSAHGAEMVLAAAAAPARSCAGLSHQNPLAQRGPGSSCETAGSDRGYRRRFRRLLSGSWASAGGQALDLDPPATRQRFCSRCFPEHGQRLPQMHRAPHGAPGSEGTGLRPPGFAFAQCQQDGAAAAPPASSGPSELQDWGTETPPDTDSLPGEGDFPTAAGRGDTEGEMLSGQSSL